MHNDRCNAVVAAADVGIIVHGLELFARSETYAWDRPVDELFRKHTLFEAGQRRSGLGLMRALIAARWRIGRGHYFLCHYERAYVLLFAWLLRLSGCAVYAMGCSKFDDFPRRSWREFLKTFYFLPYHGGLSSGVRSRDYLRFLGIAAGRIEGEYNTLSIARIRKDAQTPPAPAGVRFEDRHFTVVARLVAKKNLHVLLDAYARYRTLVECPRRLVLCGSGELEDALRRQAAALGCADAVDFTGFVQSDRIAQILGGSLALLLLSAEEQFGNVVIEAQAMGLPVILADPCGARDRLVRSGVNGFLVEPDNPAGAARMMKMLCEDRALWTRMAHAALAAAERGDVSAFAGGVFRLTGEALARSDRRAD